MWDKDCKETQTGVNKMNLTGYKTRELAMVVDLDASAVRDEAMRRAEKAEKEIIRAKAAIAKAQAELESCNAALRAVYAE
jgi:hypothetical protein